MGLPPGFRPPLEYPDIPLHETLRRSTARFPGKTALVDGGREMTFGELEERSNSCARGLTGLGVRKGDRAALLMPNSAEFEIIFYGGLKAGAVITALNPSYKEEEVRYQIEDSGAKVLFVHTSLIPIIEKVRAHLPALSEIVVTGEENPPSGYPGFDEWLSANSTEPGDEPPIDPARDLAALPYSSGTTGRPKGVMLTHRNLVCNYTQFTHNHRIDENDGALNFLPLYHIYGSMIMGGMVLAGAKQVLMPRFEAEESLKLIERHRLTLFHTVPPALLAIAQHPRTEDYDLSSLRYIMSGAAPLPPEVRRLAQERTGCLTFMGYGLTETSPVTHMNPLEEEWMKEESIGPPVSDLEQKVVDIETGERELPLGEAGELALRGPQIMQGYWRAPEETKCALRGGWLHTGDIVRIDEEGYVFILDRLKEMIKYKGFSVAPAELEALLHTHPLVADVAVTAKADDEAGEIPKAFIVLKDGGSPGGGSPTAEEFIEFVRGKVAGFKEIREVAFLGAIPKSPSGKILRRELRE
jgi:long-chain acyl-CoA synthetase